MNLHILRHPESKYHIFSDSLCVCACVRVLASVISIPQKRIIAEVPNLIFYISIIYRYYLKNFMKIEQIVNKQTHKRNLNALRLTEKISC